METKRKELIRTRVETGNMKEMIEMRINGLDNESEKNNNNEAREYGDRDKRKTLEEVGKRSDTR